LMKLEEYTLYWDMGKLSGHNEEYNWMRPRNNSGGCGCSIVSTEAPGNDLFSQSYYTAKMENGFKYDYSYSSSGKWELHDGAFGFLRSTFDSESELREEIVENCRVQNCN